MSGPVTRSDTLPVVERHRAPSRPVVEVTPAREAQVGGLPVRRALPRRGRRTVGAWCFVDHLGPSSSATLAVGPHPHIGLQTVTWLLEGEILHTDSLGSRQPIRPGQLNLMTAGHGVAHAEESAAGAPVHGVQLWVAQPDGTRDGEPAFEHHAELPRASFGAAVATVLLGELGGARSPGRTDSPLVGADVALEAGRAEIPVEMGFEHALVVLDGQVTVHGEVVAPGALAYLGSGDDAVAIDASQASRVLLLGGEPVAEEPLMWWNFVARTRDEVERARTDWQAATDRFGTVAATALARINAPEVTWRRR